MAAHRSSAARHRAARPPLRAEDPRRSLGRLGEEIAAAHMRALGFRIIERNARTRAGEIDLIAFDGHTLVFAEVKARRASAGRRGMPAGLEPLGGLGGRQRARLRRLAAAWLRTSGRPLPFAETVRFDAIGVIVDGSGAVLHLEHVEGAW